MAWIGLEDDEGDIVMRKEGCKGETGEVSAYDEDS